MSHIANDLGEVRNKAVSMEMFWFWQRWLFGIGLIISFFGIMMALFSGTLLFDWMNRQIDPVFWSAREMTEEIETFKQWIYGVLGATMAGWGIFLGFIVYYPFKRKEKWAWYCLASDLVVWFPLDIGISLHLKVYFNAAFNTLIFTLAILPLIFTRKSFQSR
ncbi:MAG: hypothetical protein ACE5NG_18780 [bacterium]